MADSCSSDDLNSDSNSIDYVSDTDNESLSNRILEAISKKKSKSNSGNVNKNNKGKDGSTFRSEENVSSRQSTPRRSLLSPAPTENRANLNPADCQGAKVIINFVTGFLKLFTISCK